MAWLRCEPINGSMRSVSDSRWSYHRPGIRRVLRRTVVLGLMCNLALTIGFTAISRHNYPGGGIGDRLERLSGNPKGKIWIPASALHTGTTLFTLPGGLERLVPPFSGPVGGNSTTGLDIIRPESAYEACAHPSGNSPEELWEAGYQYVVTEDPGLFSVQTPGTSTRRWIMLDQVYGYGGVRCSTHWPPVQVDVEPRLAILGRV